MKKITTIVFLLVSLFICPSVASGQDGAATWGLAITTDGSHGFAEFHEAVPEAWLAPEGTTPQFELQLEENIRQKTCEYTNHPNINLTLHNLSATLILTASGEVIDSRIFAAYMGCPTTTPYNTSRYATNIPVFERWLNLHLSGTGLPEVYPYTVWAVESATYMIDGESPILNPYRQILATVDNWNIQFWDIATGESTADFRLSQMLDHWAYTPNGDAIIAVDRDEFFVIDVATGEATPLDVETTYKTESMRISPDGSLFVTSGYTDDVAVIRDAATGETTAILEGHTDTVNQANFSPDGSTVITASLDDTARAWDTATGLALFQLEHEHNVYDATYSPGGHYIITASGDEAFLWDAINHEIIQVFTGHTSLVRTVDFSPDERFVVTGSWDNTARIWDVDSGALLLVLWSEAAMETVQFSMDGQFIITSDADIHVWDVSAFLGTSGSETDLSCQGTITITLHSEPDNNSQVVGETQGASYTVTAQREGWYYINDDNLMGWVQESMIAVEGPGCENLPKH